MPDEVLGSSLKENKLEGVKKTLSSCCGSAFADVCKSRSHAHLNQSLVTWYCCMAMCRNASRQHSSRNLNNLDAKDSPLNRVWGGNAQAMTNNSFATHLWKVHQGTSYQLRLEHFEYFHGAPTCTKCHVLHSFMCSCPANKLTCDSAFPLHTNGSLWQHD